MKNIKFCVYGMFAFISLFFIGSVFYKRYQLKNTVLQDIDFIHQTILENHPGPYNPADPDFVSTMNQAYAVAKKSIRTMKSSNDHQNIIKAYLDSFHDTHLRFYPNQQEATPISTHEFKHFSIKEMSGNILWITLPTFAPNKTQQIELEHVIDQLPHYKTIKTIVFDVRNNTGGNSLWGTKILENLFGKEYVAECLYRMNQHIEVDWRASKDNATYLSWLTDYISDQFGQNSKEFAEFKTVEQGVQHAYKNNEIFYTEHTVPRSTNPINIDLFISANIIVVTDAYNVSACLDFIDEIKVVAPKVLLIGETTTADTIYMEVRVIDVPSNIGKLQFPIKMYRNRSRGHNIPYVPDIAYPENIISSKERDQWLLKTIHNL